MTQDEQDKLKAEILDAHNRQVQKYIGTGDQIEWRFSETNIPDFLKRSVYRIVAKVGKWTICLIEKPAKAGVITLLIILSMLIEAEQFYYAKPEHIDGIRYEISQPKPWGDSRIKVLEGFVIVPPPEEPAPHVPEKDFVANPSPVFSVASLSGLSLPISGKYLH